jgi:hypothetical protein
MRSSKKRSPVTPDRQTCSWRLASALLAVSCLLALSACATLPPLEPPYGEEEIELPFPRGRWQLVHRIEARFKGNHKALMMGALELDSVTGHLTCALMTVEGFTLFSASETDRLEVTRAVPPFDGPGFAQGLMTDLRLLFFPPADAPTQTGSLEGRPVRRFVHADGPTTDVIAQTAGQYQIDRYDADGRPIRRAVLRMRPSSAAGQGLAGEILLEALDDAGYTLRLDLIDAVPTGTRKKNDVIGPVPKDAS